MTALLLILSLSGLGLVLAFRRSIPNYPVVAVALAGLAVLLALGRLAGGGGVHPSLREPPVYERSVGHALGQAAVAAFPDGGDLLVIRLRYEKAWARAKADAYVEGLEQGIKGSGLRIAGVEPEAVFPVAVGGMDEPSIPMADFMALLERYPGVVGVVSFCGFPLVSLEELPDSVPPLLVAGIHHLRHGRWILADRVVAMVVGRPDVWEDVDLSPKRPLEEVFASLSYLVTRENVHEIAGRLRQ